MANVNVAHLIGHLGQDPEMRFTPNGNAVTTFRIAINSYYTDKDGNRTEDTDWIQVECWNKTAEAVNNYVTKGSQVYVQGRIKTDSWEDKETNERKYRTFVRADTVQFLDSKNGKGGDEGQSQDDRPRQASRQQAATTRQPASAPRRNAPQPISDDDIPF